MKKLSRLSMYLLIALLAFSSCGKDEVTEPADSNNSGTGGDETSAYKWTYEVDNSIRSEFVLDENDNIYFVGADYNDNFSLYSIDKTGQKNWSVDVSYNIGGTNLSSIMYADGKIITTTTLGNIYCYDSNNGSLLWEKSMYSNSVAYSNNTLYVANYSIMSVELTISALNIADGSEKWTRIERKLVEPKISVNNNIICVACEDKNPYPYKFGMVVYKDNGSSCDSAWSVFSEGVSGNKPHKAIFDGQGNLYIQDGTSGKTVVYSYNENTGAENWNVQIKDVDMANDVAMIYSSGKIIATYRSDDSWGIENSFASIDASTGAILNSVEEGIHDENMLLLTGDDNLVSFTQDDQGVIHLLKYGIDGSLINTEAPDYAKDIMLSAYDNVRINGEGDLIILSGKYIYCAEHSFVKPVQGTWSSINGNNQNTNSL